MALKIYTRTGDEGKTSLFGGKRLPKHDLRIDAYGELDELNACIGLVRDHLPADHHQRAVLLDVQNELFVLGSHLATEPGKSMNLPVLDVKGSEKLELAIDALEEQLSPLKNFILPGGHTWVSHCHLARCVCRRAERRVTGLAELEPVPEMAVQYLNRLSDYLFTLARFIGKETQTEEIPWLPKI